MAAVMDGERVEHPSIVHAPTGHDDTFHHPPLDYRLPSLSLHKVWSVDQHRISSYNCFGNALKPHRLYPRPEACYAAELRS